MATTTTTPTKVLTPPPKIPSVPHAVASQLPPLRRTSQLRASFGTVLGYGPAGGGKTFSVKTLVTHKFNPLILACELGETRGCLSLAAQDIPFIEIDSHAQLIDVIRSLKRKAGKVEYAQEEFGAVVLDSVTQWGEFPLARFMEMKGWKDLHDQADRKDPRAAYAYLAEKGRQLYKELFELNAHLYLIAREGLFTAEGDVTFSAPELPGQKLPREMPGWPDATVRLRVIAGQFRMVTRGEGLSPARVRLPDNVPALPQRCRPDVGALVKYMLGDRTMFDLLKIPEGKEEKKNGPVAVD